MASDGREENDDNDVVKWWWEEVEMSEIAAGFRAECRASRVPVTLTQYASFCPLFLLHLAGYFV